MSICVLLIYTSTYTIFLNDIVLLCRMEDIFDRYSEEFIIDGVKLIAPVPKVNVISNRMIFIAHALLPLA